MQSIRTPELGHFMCTEPSKEEQSISVGSGVRELLQKAGEVARVCRNQNQQEFGKSVANFQDYIERENRKKEEKERRKQEKMERQHREEMERQAREKARIAKERRIVKKQAKIKKAEEEKMELSKAMRLQLAVCVGGLREQMQEEMRRSMEAFNAIIKGKQAAASPTSTPPGSPTSYTSNLEASEVEEISQRAKDLTIGDKRKRSPNATIGNSPSMEVSPTQVSFRLHEVDGVHPILCNGNNIPKTRHPDRMNLLRREIEKAFGRWGNDGGRTLCVTSEEVRSYLISSETSGDISLDIEVVKETRRRFEGLVLTPRDRNPGETYVMCPYLYFEAMMGTFVINPGYEVVQQSEEEVKETVHMAFKKEAIPSDLSIVLGPATRTGKCVAKALNHMLFHLPALWHFNLRSVSEVTMRIEKINKKCDAKPNSAVQLTAMSYDVKDMFSKLSHHDIMEAVTWIIDHYVSKGQDTIRVNTRGKGCTFGRTTGADHWRAMKLSDIKDFVSVDLEHTYVYATGVLLGIPMGKSTSLPLACILCTYSEFKFLSSLGNLRRRVYGLRLMDDVSLIIDVGRGMGSATEERIRSSFESCYPGNLTLKRTDEGNGMWDFLGLEMCVRDVSPHVSSVQVSKNEKPVWTTESLEFKCGQSYRSWGSKQAKSAVVASYLHRIDSNTALRSEIPLAWRVLTLSRELRLKDFPGEFVNRTLKRFSTGRGEIWGLTRDWICDT
ncbi:hypothetical protein CBR_g32287 [Chara braunii]|uniref:Reverse transcriptase domain-containing protein n=1 Tax=Chara braunii TaxID=69332 RepID=A0A388JNI8_CHABU|nr:hypothetical protein CBR_g32287 [Chara braunii]|eukprot:GBG59272.1 hypothetical protein CBR_g32287 [Chara braunii]